MSAASILPWTAIGPVLSLHQYRDGKCTCPYGAACKAPAKHPVASDVVHGVKDATTDETIIARWRHDYGVAMGHVMADGRYAFAYDVDPRNGGDVSHAALVAEHGELPETVQNISGGDGAHYVLSSPFPVTSTTLGKGIDIVGTGKYIKVHGSHASGGMYRSELGCHPRDIEVAHAPDWLLAMLAPHAVSDVVVTERSGLDTVIGECCRLAGLVGRPQPDGAVWIRCPVNGHSDGRGQGEDDSTVLLAQVEGSRFGMIDCRHGSCAGKFSTVNPKTKKQDPTKALDHFAPEIVRAAKAKYPMPKTLTVVPPPPVVEEKSTELSDGVKAEIANVLRLFSCDVAGRPQKTIATVTTVLRHDPRWKGVIVWDEFSQVIRFTRPPPWLPEDVHSVPSMVWIDSDVTRLSSWFTKTYGGHGKAYEIDATKLEAGVIVVAEANARNPVVSWLDSLTWDGVPRLDTWLTILGAENSAYTRSVGSKWLISGVARIRRPGCKADHVLILEGPQGRGKSTALAALVPFPEWFSDTPLVIGNKDSYQALRGKLIVELAELASLTNAEADKIKAFFSSPTDYFRPPYGKSMTDNPRRCIFAGSTNSTEYLKDETGNRRYWPVKCGVLDIEGLRAVRDQLWAEADVRYQNKEPWWPSYDETGAFETEQASRLEHDVWAETIEQWLKGTKATALLALDSKTGVITAAHILEHALKIKVGDHTKAHQIRVGKVMSALGWTISRPGTGAARVRGYRPRVQYVQ